MRVIEHEEDIRGLGDAPIATVGKFEGVHRGHAAILSEVCRRGEAACAESVVVTFEPHPQGVLDPSHPPLLLSTKQEKLEVLARFGIRVVVLLPFTARTANLAPAEFVRRILVERVQVRELVVGYNFLFGKDRAGDSNLLEELGRVYGFTVDVVPPVMVAGAAVSSSRIRACIAAGDMPGAARLLGRPYALRGGVVRGDGRGKELGFPTANLDVDPQKLLPPDGVYAAQARVLDPKEAGGDAWRGLLNIGLRPSFGGTDRTVEVFLEDFSGDLYDRQLEVDIIQRVRDERDFANWKDLASQIEKDRNATERILSRDLRPSSGCGMLPGAG